MNLDFKEIKKRDETMINLMSVKVLNSIKEIVNSIVEGIHD